MNPGLAWERSFILCMLKLFLLHTQTCTFYNCCSWQNWGSLAVAGPLPRWVAAQVLSEYNAFSVLIFIYPSCEVSSLHVQGFHRTILTLLVSCLYRTSQRTYIPWPVFALDLSSITSYSCDQLQLVLPNSFSWSCFHNHPMSPKHSHQKWSFLDEWSFTFSCLTIHPWGHFLCGHYYLHAPCGWGQNCRCVWIYTHLQWV